MTTRLSPAYQQAASMIKTQGILSIGFGALGLVFTLFLIGYMAMVAAASGGGGLELTSGIFGIFMATIFLLIPNAYLLASGIVLYRLPSPNLVRVFAIITMVVYFWNIILLAFSIVTLVQADDYQKGHHTK